MLCRGRLDLTAVQLRRAWSLAWAGSAADASEAEASVLSVAGADPSESPPANGPVSLVVGSVRAGWRLVLEAAGWRPGGEVLMSAVNVPRMFDLVRDHGLIPVPFDLDPATGQPCVDDAIARLTGPTVAVVVAPLFGVPGRPGQLAEECRRRGVPLVLDSAQHWPDEGLARPPVADVELFSFGPLKRKTALGGGLLRVTDRDLGERIRTLRDRTPVPGPGRFRSRVVRFTLLSVASRPSVFGVLAGAARLSGLSVDGLFDAAVKNAPRPSSADLPPRLGVAQLRFLAERLAGSTVWDETYRQAAQAWLAARPPTIRLEIDADSQHWLVTVQVDDPERLRDRLRRARFDSGRLTRLALLSSPLDPANHSRLGPPIETPVASRVLARTVIIPFQTDAPQEQQTQLGPLVDRPVKVPSFMSTEEKET